MKTIVELRELCEKATKGPWGVPGRGTSLGRVLVSKGGSMTGWDGMITECDAGNNARSQSESSVNAEFISAARTALPLLLDEIQTLRETLAIYANEDHLINFEKWDTVSGEEIVENSLWARNALANSKERLP